jgi:hypothetical protein
MWSADPTPGDLFTDCVAFPHLTLLAQREWDRVCGATVGTASGALLVQLDG